MDSHRGDMRASSNTGSLNHSHNMGSNMDNLNSNMDSRNTASSNTGRYRLPSTRRATASSLYGERR